ncbi:MAG TPA: hypothetical protein VFE24_07130 [Pirellulales bacterium]|nr:hypothetical protein [Pirellulales bacterium]
MPLDLHQCNALLEALLMPKDYWKKARDSDHAKRASLERATGAPLSYHYAWEDDGFGSVESPIASPSLQDHSIPTLSSEIKNWLDRLKGRNAVAEKARKHLETFGPKDSAAVPVIIRACGDSSDWVKQVLVGVLTKIGESAIPHLTQGVREGTKAEREFSGECLAQFGELARTSVLDLMDHGEKKVRLTAIKAARMGAVGYESLWATLINGTPLQQESVRTVFESSGPKAVSFLLNRLECETLENGLKAITHLGHLGEQARKILPHLLEILTNADDSQVISAISKACDQIRREMGIRISARYVTQPTLPMRRIVVEKPTRLPLRKKHKSKNSRRPK